MELVTTSTETIVTPVIPSTPVVVTDTSTVDALKAELAALKAKLESVTPAAPVPMTLEEAKAHMAEFEGKRGRRPASFYEAREIVKAAEPKPDPAVVKAQLKAAKEAAKLEAKAALEAEKTENRRAALEKAYNKAKKASDKVAKVFLALSTKAEALEAQLKALPAVTE
jgi:CelD/BcsL family acetyltransferase involved in cellulose biosynthesis